MSDIEGFAEFYNVVYDALRAARPDAVICGPYMNGLSHAAFTNNGTLTRKTGDAFDHFFDNKHGADAINDDRRRIQQSDHLVFTLLISQVQNWKVSEGSFFCTNIYAKSKRNPIVIKIPKKQSIYSHIIIETQSLTSLWCVANRRVQFRSGVHKRFNLVQPVTDHSWRGALDLRITPGTGAIALLPINIDIGERFHGIAFA